MNIRTGFCIFCLFLVGLAGCATSTNGSSSVLERERLSISQGVISLPYEVYGNGVYAVNGVLDNGQEGLFLIDTGATRSAVFKKVAKSLSLKPEAHMQVMVHGMTSRDQKPVVNLGGLTLANTRLENVRAVILDDREEGLEKDIDPIGLIGMDVLGNYRVFVDADSKTFNLISKNLPPLDLPNTWKLIQLQTNPYDGLDHGLHFLDIRIGNRLVPALLDTGSEVNIINWNSLYFPQLKTMRRRLRDQWILNGAVGTFEPVSLIKVENFRSGQKRWERRSFYVMDFDNLEILGVDQQPFVIAGADLFSGNSFYLDFDLNQLIVRPEAYDNMVNWRREADIVVRQQ